MAKEAVKNIAASIRARLELSHTIAEAMAKLEAFMEPVCAATEGDNATWSPKECRWR